MRAKVQWAPVSDLPAYLEGRRILLWLEHGENGNGEVAVGMLFRNDDGVFDHYWTWGGTSSGSDIDEAPTKWALVPFAPDGSEHD